MTRISHFVPRILYLVTRTSYLVILLLALLSCHGTQRDAAKVEGDTLQFKYASLLTIVDYDGYSVATIANPWKKDKVLHTYILVPRDAESPALTASDGSADGITSTIRIPIQRAAVFTTVHCSLLMTFGCQDRIAGVADLEYIKIPWIHEQVGKGSIVDCGGGLNPVVEKIIDTKPDIIMLSPFENSGGYGKVEELDIPIMECAEYMESSPLARAEWMKFYGRLFGCQAKADSLFAVVDSSYHALKSQASKAGRGRSVLVDKLVGSVWYVPGGKSTIGQMLQDAGADYAWSDDDHSGSLSLPFETVLERAGESDLWIYRYSSNHAQTLPELLSEHHGYSQLRPFQTGEVYGCNVDQSLFYEESPFRPDYLLGDFIRLIHPDMTNLPPLRYYEKIKD